MTKDNDKPTVVAVAEGILAMTAGLSKKKVCCCPPSQAIQLANELEAAAKEVRAQYTEVDP